MSNIDNERIKKYFGSVEERINFNKENGCKLLDCKVIDANIKLRQENIKLKKISEKLAIEVENLDDMLSAELGSHTRGYCKIENGCIFNHKRKCSECIIDWARKEVEKDV